MNGAPAHIDLWPDRTLIVSQLGKVSSHQHAAAAVLVGLDGPFGIKWKKGAFVATRSAFVAAGVRHALECGSTLMATLYLFPMTGAAAAFAQAVGIPGHGVSVGLDLPHQVVERLLSIHGGDWDRDSTRAWTDGFVGASAPPPLDYRLKKVAERLRVGAADGVAASQLASEFGISESRLMHLFKHGAGVSLRRYRIWERMRLVAVHVGSGDNLTMAGLAAGFADSSHLSHGFRNMFGIPASRVLNPHARIRSGPDGAKEPET